AGGGGGEMVDGEPLGLRAEAQPAIGWAAVDHPEFAFIAAADAVEAYDRRGGGRQLVFGIRPKTWCWPVFGEKGATRIRCCAQSGVGRHVPHQSEVPMLHSRGETLSSKGKAWPKQTAQAHEKKSMVTSP